MPAEYIFHTTLTEPLLRYAWAQVAAGRHDIASVVRTALETSMQRDVTAGPRVDGVVPGRSKHG